MAVSDVSTWNPALVEIINDALLNVGEIEEGEAASPQAYASCLRKINGLVKLLEATGIHVWTEAEGILFPQVGVAKYVLGGPAPTAHAADADAWELQTTTANAVAGTSTIAVVDATLIADGFHIGIVLQSGVTQWTTVSGAPASNVVTLAAALDEAVNEGAYVIAYETDLGRALKVPNARLLTYAVNPQNYNENQMIVFARSDYMNQPNKLTQGVPTQWFYSPQRETGLFYIWPVPNVTNWAIRYTWYRPLLDFLTPDNTADMPQEWILPLTWALTKEIAPSYGVPEATWTRIKEMAESYELTALSWDRESEPIQFGFDSWGGEE